MDFRLLCKPCKNITGCIFSCRMKKTFDYIVPISESKNTSVIVGVGSVESSYLIQVGNFKHRAVTYSFVFL